MTDKSNRKRGNNKNRRLRHKFVMEANRHDDFMNYHLDDTNESVHHLALLQYKHYKQLEDNIILLDNPIVVDGKKLSRKIYYSIKSVGKNIVLECNNEGSKIIKFRETKKNFVMIVIHKKDLIHIPKTTTFSFDNDATKKKRFRQKSEKFVILMQCGDFSRISCSENDNINIGDLKNIKNVIPNQITREKHFKSRGEVYSVGYSAKYKVENQKSFDKFVTSKY